MYNPVSMKIEDEKRLYEKDLREKNKKARYEVRYDVEAQVRKEGLAEQDREDSMKLNKISGLRYREEMARGFDILTNQKMDGSATTIKIEKVNKSGPVAAWNKVLHNANENEHLQEQIQKLAEEEYYQRLKQQGVNADFRKTELEKLSALAKEDPLNQTQYATRSKRVTRGMSQAAPSEKPASKASKAPEIPQNQVPLASRAQSSAPKSQAAVSKGPASSAKASGAPLASAKAASVAPASSRREIRTGGFSKLGSEIMGK